MPRVEPRASTGPSLSTARPASRASKVRSMLTRAESGILRAAGLGCLGSALGTIGAGFAGMEAAAGVGRVVTCAKAETAAKKRMADFIERLLRAVVRGFPRRGAGYRYASARGRAPGLPVGGRGG